MSGIQDIVQQQLTPDTISRISSAIGADPVTTQQAVSAAVPMMMDGMAAPAASPSGAQAIDTAAEEHSGMLVSITGMPGGGNGAGGLGGLGGLGGMLGSAAAGGILGKVLGSNHSDAQNGMTQASGLDPAKAGKLLMILAPIVLAAIARHKQQTGANPTQVSNDLQREAQHQADQNALN